jgi:cell wall-associated NlpC family hydrolase
MRPMFRFCTVFLCALSAACASTGGVPQPFPVPGHHPPSVPAGTRPEPVGTAGGGGYALAGTALGLRGVPYQNGGADPSGFDCSGFVWYVFGQHGIPVPRTVSELFQLGKKVLPDALAAGDLVFFRTNGQSVSHVGMSIGGDEFVHAPSAQGEVRVERLGSSYWAPRFVGARRY